MKEKNTYVLYDAFIFGIKNSLAYFRPVFLTFFAVAAIAIIIGGMGVISLVGISTVTSFINDLFHAMSTPQLWLQGSFIVLFTFPFILLILMLPMIIFMHYGLAIFNGQMTQRVLLPSFFKISKVFVAMIIQAIGLTIGILLFIVPGFFWLIRTSFVGYHILDSDAGIIESFKHSFGITKGNGWQIIVWWLLNIAVVKFLYGAVLFPIALFSGAYLYKIWEK